MVVVEMMVVVMVVASRRQLELRQDDEGKTTSMR